MIHGTNVRFTGCTFRHTDEGPGDLMALTLDIRLACPVCGGSLNDDEQKTAPLVYTDAICSEKHPNGQESCMVWLGRTICWLDEKRRAKLEQHLGVKLELDDPFWINEKQ